MLPGRNDLCYCGSGKKYKNCCMDKDLQKERHERRLKEAQKQYAEIYAKLYAYSRKEEFKNEYKRAEEIFYILDNEEVKIKFERFFETYYMQDHITESGKVIATKFYNDPEIKLTNNEKLILQSIGNSYISIYDVMKVESDKILLKDCFTGEELYTEETKLLNGFVEGESLMARVVEVSGVNLLIDITVKIIANVKDFIVNDINRLFKQYEKDCPNMKLFLSYHTYIFYRYMQQLLDEASSAAMRNESGQKKEEPKDNTVVSILESIADKECLEKCIETWKSYEESNSEIKGSEYGWAAAVEYFVKKEAGENITQAQISKKYEISPSTLGKRYKELKSSN